MLQGELTVGLRRLAAELDELAVETRPTIPPFPVIPDFEPLGLLGCGGMGAVYAARQVSLARDVAVKVVATSGTGTSFPEEARTVARLHHPNIVQVFAAGRTEGVAWFAMELVPGESADRHVFVSAEDVARLGVAVADALAYAHRCGLLHRDVKPSNIFVGEDGAIKLGDFGLACLAADKLSDRSGTRHYLAPERLDGGAATAAGDLYALGVTLRDLGACKDFRMPTDFAAICAKATASEPSARYTDANALADDLRRFLAHRPVAANPPAPLRRFRLFARRNPLAAGGLVAAAIGLVACAVALALGTVRTARAQAATHREAVQTAQALVSALATVERRESDPRDAKLRRALKTAEALAARYPDDATIREALETLRKAHEFRTKRLARPRRAIQASDGNAARPSPRRLRQPQNQRPNARLR